MDNKTNKQNIKIPEDLSFLDNVPDVKNLRQNGKKVRVVHYRYYDNFRYCPITKEQASGIKIILKIGNIYPQGGLTEVFIQDGKTTYRGWSDCSVNDNFNRRRGVKIAIYRALLLGKI